MLLVVQAQPTEKHAKEEAKEDAPKEDGPGDDVSKQDASQEQGEEEETGGCEDPEVPVECHAEDMAVGTQAEDAD